MKKILLTIIGNLLLSGSLLSQNWSKSDIELFVKECITEAENYFTKDGALEYCNCSAEKVMELYPDVLSVENLTDKEIGIVAFECVSQILETRDDVFLSWDETTKAAFIESCEEELTGTEVNAKSYCPCALEEVIILYPTPFEAMSIAPDVLERIALKCIE
jgi:hypothetical protein